MVLVLVSVRQAEEAGLAWRAGVPWIDLKEPAHGSLGCPTREVAQQVSDQLRELAGDATGRHPCSVALGELDELTPERLDIARLFPFAKVGLSRQDHQRQWKARLIDLQRQLQPETELVPVIYADTQGESSPAWDQVLEVSQQMRPPWLLVDTFHKHLPRLSQLPGADWLEELCLQAHQSGIRVALAGRLGLEDLMWAAQLGCDMMGFRSAVSRGGQREDAIDPQRIEALLRAVDAGSSEPWRSEPAVQRQG
jgi:(5-formylfuran-3-yl)methyl phosphate synthase